MAEKHRNKTHLWNNSLDAIACVTGAKQMNSEQAKLLALTGQGEKITHLKGGVYEVVGFCRVQINGRWEEAIQYKNGTLVYVRLIADCEKLEIFGGDK